MPNIELTKTDIPFLLDGSSSLQVQANVADLDHPLAPGNEDLFNLGFNVAGGHSFAIGAQDSVKLGLEAKTSARLIPLWASSSSERLKLLESYGLSGYFDPAQNHDGRLLMLLALGAEADASVTGKYSYSVLSVDATLKAGADAGYALVRSYPAGTVARDNHGFLQSVALARERQRAACRRRSDRLRVRRLFAIQREHGRRL
ncbi:MAG: hypothetical protein ACR2LC_00270 [Pyrinomonadaceae bacterium]